MTRDEAVSYMQVVLGFRTDLGSRLQTELQQAQNNLEQGTVLPEFLKTERAFTFTTVSDERVLLPGDFLREAEPSALYYVPDDATLAEVELAKEDEDYLRYWYGIRTGKPEAYSIDNEYFRLFPKPDASYRVKMIYFGKDDALTSNIENKWLRYAPDFLVGAAGLRVSTGLRDRRATGEFARMRDEGRAAIFTADEARRHQNRSYFMGSRV